MEYAGMVETPCKWMPFSHFSVTTSDQNFWWISDCLKSMNWYEMQNYNDSYISKENENFQSLSEES